MNFSPSRARHLMMVRPAMIGYNEWTASNNSFQNPDTLEIKREKRQELALEEFEQLLEKIRKAGINVHVFQDTLDPIKPDAVFPNNWVSFHQDGRVALYPMFAPNRRSEKRPDILESLSGPFEVKEVIDWSSSEEAEEFLESTGSMVLDRKNRIAYAAYSSRTHPQAFQRFGDVFEYELLGFEALDYRGIPIYHTNVMMNIGEKYAIACLDIVNQDSEKKKIIHKLQNTGHEIIPISEQQMGNFAGNMLEVENNQSEAFLIMSERAFQALDATQIQKIEQYAQIIYSPLTTIEHNGGGSARCMLAEIFLPEK